MRSINIDSATPMLSADCLIIALGWD